HRQITAGEALSGSHQVRSYSESVGPEPSSEPPKSANDLVEYEQNVKPVEDLADRAEIMLRGHEHASGTHHRFGNESRNRLGSFKKYGLFKIVRIVSCSALRGVISVRPIDMPHHRQRQIKKSMHTRQSGKTSSRDGHAMIAAPPSDDLLLLLFLPEVVVKRDQLDCGVVCI